MVGEGRVGVGVLFEVIEPPPQPANSRVAPNATYFSTVSLPRSAICRRGKGTLGST